MGHYANEEDFDKYCDYSLTDEEYEFWKTINEAERTEQDG